MEFPCEECVAWASPEFRLWAGESPGSNYGGKPIVDFDGAPAFAEIAIVRAVRDAGWSAVWVSQAFGRPKFRDTYWGKPVNPKVPGSVLVLLADIAARRSGSYKGTWDVVAWPAGSDNPSLSELLFIEAKRHGRDSIDIEQVRWYETMRARGATRSQFLVVDWKIADRVI
jgi:hypothetical protein